MQELQVPPLTLSVYLFLYLYPTTTKQGEKLVLLLREGELMERDYLVYLSEFIISGAISHLFTQVCDIAGIDHDIE